MTADNDKQKDLKLMSTLNDVLARREDDVDGNRMARSIMRAVGQPARSDKPHRRIMLRLVKYAAPLAAAATLLLIVYFAGNTPEAQALTIDEAVTLAEQAFTQSDVQLFNIETTMQINGRDVTRYSRLYAASGGRFVYEMDGPFGTSWLGSDGTRYWFKPSRMGVMIFEDEQSLRSKIRDLPMLRHLMHRFLKLNNLIETVRQNSETPTFVEKAKDGPWRLRMRPRQPGRPEGEDRVEKVDIVVDPETKQVGQLVIETVFNEGSNKEMTRTMTLTRADAGEVTETVFVPENHVDPETGIVDPDAYIDKLRKRRDQWKNYNPKPGQRPFDRFRRDGRHPRRPGPHDRQPPHPPHPPEEQPL